MKALQFSASAAKFLVLKPLGALFPSLFYKGPLARSVVNSGHQIFYAAKILMAGKMQPTFPRGDVSDIAQPDLIRRRCLKLLIRHIRRV